MKFQFWHGQPQSAVSDCIMIAIHDKYILSRSAHAINAKTKGVLQKLAKSQDLPKKLGETILLPHLDTLKTPRILVVHTGKEKLALGEFRKILTHSFSALKNLTIKKVLVCLAELNVDNTTFKDKIKHIIEIASSVSFEFNEYRSEKKPSTLQLIELYLPSKNDLKLAEKGLKQGLAIAKGVELTRYLANQPANVCHPAWMAKQALHLTKNYASIKVKVVDEKEMRKLGMGAFLAVAAGSEHPPKLVSISYKGTSKKIPPTVFVGKGITFDTGGLSLKPAESMVGMKYDMCGAATVLGIIKAAAEMKLPTHIIGILALAENMPSGKASRPEDIVTSLSGQTIEILNTDAEGRLVLCDALTYAERYKPKTVIDIATLTGAVVIALGEHATGLLSNDQSLANALLSAGEKTHDRAWQLPLWEEYQIQLKSPFADMSNVGGRQAGTITAACFLSRFTKKYRWAHLDVAGTAAFMFGNSRSATGRPVPMLMQYLIDELEQEK